MKVISVVIMNYHNYLLSNIEHFYTYRYNKENMACQVIVQ